MKELAITFIIIYIYDKGIVYLDVNILFSTFLLHLNSYHIDDKLL